jgi:hypothetical protein
VVQVWDWNGSGNHDYLGQVPRAQKPAAPEGCVRSAPPPL